MQRLDPPPSLETDLGAQIQRVAIIHLKIPWEKRSPINLYGSA
jgi:hypothetical protein